MDLQSTVATLRNNPKGIRFADLANICNHFLGGTTANIVPAISFTECPGPEIL